jgi:glutaminyl-tRNA synthetase
MKIVTWFPPEPNGLLNQLQQSHLRSTLALQDTTAGSAISALMIQIQQERRRNILHDQRDDQWLDFKPSQVIYSSDNFDRLYELAEDLIKRDKRICLPSHKYVVLNCPYF